MRWELIIWGWTRWTRGGLGGAGIFGTRGRPSRETLFSSRSCFSHLSTLSFDLTGGLRGSTGGKAWTFKSLSSSSKWMEMGFDLVAGKVAWSISMGGQWNCKHWINRKPESTPLLWDRPHLGFSLVSWSPQITDERSKWDDIYLVWK